MGKKARIVLLVGSGERKALKKGEGDRKWDGPFSTGVGRDWKRPFDR